MVQGFKTRCRCGAALNKRELRNPLFKLLIGRGGSEESFCSKPCLDRACQGVGLFRCDEAAVQLFQCPICHKFCLTSEDPLDNTWVALGEAVCSKECHEKAYALMREKQHEIVFYHPQPP